VASSPLTAAARPQDFSLVLGGPFFQLLRRSRLSGDVLELVHQRITAFVAIAWLPLVVLSLVDGMTRTASLSVPFLKDVEANGRFLIAMPLLIVAELIVHQRMLPVVGQFLDRQLIPDSALPQFEAAIASSFRLRNSFIAEIVLIGLVYGVGVMVFWRSYLALSTATWYAMPGAGGLTLSLAGKWYAYVSLPLFQFLLLRWYYRLLIWAAFLWHISRIPLQLVPTHPDRVGGLGFLSNIVYAFTPLAAAHGVMLAGLIANRIFYTGARLPDFKLEIGLILGFLLAVVFGPFIVFSPQLARAKRMGLREYGTLAGRYVREFDEKWLRGGATANEPLVGSADLQSLADLANSFDVVKTMRVAPITRDAFLFLGVATLAPLLPLGLTMMSPEELLKKLFGMLF
jgi:hypothetical protein